jgi:hypothetical protein
MLKAIVVLIALFPALIDRARANTHSVSDNFAETEDCTGSK